MDEKNDEKKQFSEELGEDNLAQKERRLIKDLENQYYSPQVDEVWCVIDAKWLRLWKEFTSYDVKSEEADEPIASSCVSRPGAIDNSHLLEEGSEALKRSLIQNEDYEIIHEKVWDALCDWYTGAPTIRRYVIEQGRSYNKQSVVNLYPVFLKWGYADDSQHEGLPKEENRKVSQVSRTLKLKELREYLKDRPVDPEKQHDEIRLNMPLGVVNKMKPWFSSPTEEDNKRFIEVSPEEDEIELEECDFTGHDLHVIVSQRINNEWSFPTPTPHQYRLGEIYDIEDKNHKPYEGFIRVIKDETLRVHFINWEMKWDEEIPVGSKEERFHVRGTFTTGPRKPKNKYQVADPYNYNSGYTRYNANEEGASTSVGIVGLRNLGNTCFMNSTLQCLMQSPWLSEFFINGKWKEDINRENALGKSGRVAEQYGALVRAAFSNKYRVVAPRDFKRVIGEFAPQFMGYQQQDSQELLAFLLDGLHEDLNRIKVKPYTENKESDGREDNIVANETWETYKRRNNSIIVDLMQGQYKSKLVCPTCNRTSITFDPFMYLTVPLPRMKFKTQPLTWVPGDGKTMKQYGIKVVKSGDVSDLKQKIAAFFNVDPKWLVLADNWKEKLHRICKDTDPIMNLRGSTVDLWVYYAPPANTASKKEPEVVEAEQEPVPGEEPEAGGEGKLALQEGEQEQPNYYFCPIHNLAVSKMYVYSTTTTIGIPPLFITLQDTDELTNAQVFDILCEQLKLYGFWKPTEEGGEENPFTITWTPEERYGFSMRNENDLERNDEHFSISTRVRFTILWKSRSRQDIEIEKDESYPQVERYNSDESYDLSSCLSAFTEEEVLSKENAWYCNKCKEFQMASKKMEIWRLPDLLVIHLKRFSFSRHYRNKITSLVRFPLKDLDLENWVSKSCKLNQTTKYDLYGASMHSGGMGGGHYTAYAQSVKNNEWYYLNDSSVSRADAKDTQSPCAYLLFYKRQKK